MPSLTHQIALALCLYALGLAHAGELNRCLIDGKITITDQPCPRVEKSLPGQKIPTESLRPPAISPEPAPLKQRQLSPEVKKQPPRQAATAPREQPNLLSSIFSNTSMMLLAGLAIFLAAIGKSSRRKTRASRPASKPAATPYLIKTPDSIPDFQPRQPEEENIPYKQAPVMSRHELAFLKQLRTALPECEIFPQVPLAAFIRIDRQKAGASFYKNSYRWQNRIGQQRVDFLVCLRSSMEVVSAIELDDPSHENDEAQSRDQKKDKSLLDAGVKLIRWRVENPPTTENIRQALGF